MGKIFCIIGKSSSGKDTLYKLLIERNSQLNTIVPYTTRPIREGERDGVEYFFVDADRFHDMQEKNRIIESRSYNTKCGIWTYFTADDGQISLKDKDYLMIGTLVSYMALKEYFGEESVVAIYIETDDGIRLERALKREQEQAAPKYAEMCRRFLADSEDFSEERLEKAGIRRRFNNNELNVCLDQIELFIREQSAVR